MLKKRFSFCFCYYVIIIKEPPSYAAVAAFLSKVSYSSYELKEHFLMLIKYIFKR